METKLTGLELLRAPFEKRQISLLPKPYKKDSPKGKCDVCGGFHGLPAVHLEYVGHAALTDRLLSADIKWSWEPMSLNEQGLPRFDESGGLWIKLTVCGVTRLGYGHAETSNYKDIGAREKEVIGDALRNAAMRFGAALDLWHKGDLHGEDEEQPKAKNPIFEKTTKPVEDYIIPFGLYKGKLLKDLKYQDILDLMTKTEDSIENGYIDQKTGEQKYISPTMKKTMKEFLKKAQDYLESLPGIPELDKGEIK